jgi:hypothetical protein
MLTPFYQLVSAAHCHNPRALSLGAAPAAVNHSRIALFFNVVQSLAV